MTNENTYQGWVGFAVTFTFDETGKPTSVYVDGPDEGDPFLRIGPLCWADGPDHPDGDWIHDDAATGNADAIVIATCDYATLAAELARKHLAAGYEIGD